MDWFCAKTSNDSNMFCHVDKFSTTIPAPYDDINFSWKMEVQDGKWLSRDSLMPENNRALQVPIRNPGTLCLLMKHSLESKPVLCRKTGTLCFMMKHSWNQAVKWLSFCLHSKDFLRSCDQKDSLKSYQTAKVSKPLTALRLSKFVVKSWQVMRLSSDFLLPWTAKRLKKLLSQSHE